MNEVIETITDALEVEAERDRLLEQRPLPGTPAHTRLRDLAAALENYERRKAGRRALVFTS